MREGLVARPRLLIIDDEESTRLLLARILAADLTADIQLAGTCEQAIRLSHESAYDAILLDLLMPGVGGFAVLKEIRAGGPNAATPVIVVSVVTEGDTIADVMRAGATAYHKKPVRRDTLVQVVKEQLAARKRSTART